VASAVTIRSLGRMPMTAAMRSTSWTVRGEVAVGFKRRARVTSGMPVWSARDLMESPRWASSSATTRERLAAKDWICVIRNTLHAERNKHKGCSASRSGNDPLGTYFVPGSNSLFDVLNLRDALVQTIDAERGVRRWSVRELSEHSGVKYGTLRNYLEHGRDIPSTSLAAIAGAFGWRASRLTQEAERRIDAEREQS
jgi:hypothetical protein